MKRVHFFFWLIKLELMQQQDLKDRDKHRAAIRAGEATEGKMKTRRSEVGERRVL